MTEENSSIELHDSEVRSITIIDSRVVVEVDAVLHQSAGQPGVDSGTVWSQPTTMTFEDATLDASPEGGKLTILDGEVRVDGTTYSNVLPIPFSQSGAVEFLAYGSAGQLHVLGRRCIIELYGSPTLLEAFN